jgi:ubiquinol-cytochrome c reductase cytochrome b subunit
LRVLDWLDERTGYRALTRAAFDEEIQGGARWAYVFGSGLAVVLLSQLVTGLLLMVTYTPSVHDAWSSVFYVQHRVTGGWFIRGLHHYGAYAMMLVMGLHMLQVVVYGAYKRPREVGWWVGLALLALVVGLGITGYLLPWDQKGYWATTVATNIAGSTPLVGPMIRDLVVGGPEYGQSTLTRMFALHVGVLPGLVGLVLVAHVALFRRHGPTTPAGADLARRERYFPAQIGRDLLFAVGVLACVAFATLKIGAPLDAPADPSIVYPPRPEAYFLWLYQLLNLVPGELEILVTLGLPVVGGGLLFALPFFDRRPTTRVRDRLPFVVPVLLAAVAIVALTVIALRADANDPEYQAQRRDADARAARAIALARKGIPPGGPLAMLDDDPLTRGADLFAAHCAGCHVLDGEGERWAPEHTGLGSRAWLRGLLHAPDDARYFGLTGLVGMPSQDRLGDAQLASVTEYVFSLGHEPQDPPFDAVLAAQGQRVFETKCMNCHAFEGDGDYLAEGGPDMTAYGSRTWLLRQTADPARHYGESNEMPPYGEDLSEHDLRMLAAFLRLQRFEAPSTGALVPPLDDKQRAALAEHAQKARAAAE